MDRNWTPASRRPDKLYRVCRIHQYTRYARDEGFTARDLETRFYGPENTDAFLKSIQDHRQQIPKLTPYISLFEDEAEAEMWALAAERVFRTDVNVMVINAKSEYLSDTPMWKMWDIERQTGIKLHTGADSEWLVLHHIPAPAIKGQKGGVQIRHERRRILPKLGYLFPMGKYSVPDFVPNRQESPTASPKKRGLHPMLIDVTTRECPCLSTDTCTHQH